MNTAIVDTRAPSRRRVAELVLRLVGVGALVVALVLALRRPSRDSVRAPGRISRVALRDSSANGAVAELTSIIVRDASVRDASVRDGRVAAESAPAVSSRVHVALSVVPSTSVRAALATAANAGFGVHWTDSTRASGLAITTTAVADPAGGTIVRARADAGSPLVIGDAASTLDSVPSARAGLTVRGARLTGAVGAVLGESRASSRVPKAPTLRRVLLFARPGWEAKFTTAALEERGWQVDGRLLIARRAAVTLGGVNSAGSSFPLDTARYAAAIVLDSGVASAESLSRFVRQGGGVILSGDALLGAAFGALRPATITGERARVPGALLTDAPRRGLAAWELRAAARTVVLQSESHDRHDDPTVVVWRVGTGRVAASAYRESWRWRMEGRDDGIDAHREWWSALVGTVAFMPSPADSSRNAHVLLDERLPGDAAPYADLVARLGEPVPMPASVRDAPATPPRLWLLYLVATVALLAEWGLRRMRGAR